MKITCEIHKNYKGFKKSKRPCDQCELVYKNAQRIKKESFKGFPSLVVPGETYSVEHILAEISCKMLYGNLPPYFWRKDAQVPDNIKEHYKKVFFTCKQWGQKVYSKPIYGNNPVEVFKKILFYIVTKQQSEEKIKIDQSVTLTTKENLIKQEEAESVNKTEVFFDAVQKKSKFESMKELGD